jgi:hypothetical protein
MTTVPRFHHVNLGVPPEDMGSQEKFLVEVLAYTPMTVDEELAALGAHWFEGEDGSQIHLSPDPDHRPAARAHVAVEYGPELTDVEARLEMARVKYDRFERPGFPAIVICVDPAGNRWELRGSPTTIDVAG